MPKEIRYITSDGSTYTEPLPSLPDGQFAPITRLHWGPYSDHLLWALLAEDLTDVNCALSTNNASWLGQENAPNICHTLIQYKRTTYPTIIDIQQVVINLFSNYGETAIIIWEEFAKGTEETKILSWCQDTTVQISTSFYETPWCDDEDVIWAHIAIYFDTTCIDE